MRATLILSSVLVLGLGTAVSGAADAAPKTKAQSAKGSVASGPTGFVIDAKRAAGAPATAATGTFDGQIVLGGTRVLRFAGPVTCLDVQGARMGLFYPIKESEPALVASFGSGIFINVTTDGKDGVQSFSFTPSMSSVATACAPAATPNPATGRLVLRS